MRHLNYDHEGGTTMGHPHHDHQGDRSMSHHDHALGASDLGDSFSRDTSGLPTATSPETINLGDGDVFEIRGLPVRKRIGAVEVRMLGYNGSIPGPTLRVDQGSEATVDFTNETDLETTVHWHGLRLDYRFDGLPGAPTMTSGGRSEWVIA
jgi:hypothetical protein